MASALGALTMAPAHAQDVPDRPLPELEYQADRAEETETLEEEEALFAARPRPWSIAPWIPANWRSNLAQAPRALRSGIAFEPEATLGRSWGLGPVTLRTDASAFVSAVPSDAVRDSSGWWLTAEASAGDARSGLAPYAEYEPLTLHDGIFGGRLLTFHTLTVGVRRQWGPTSLNLFLRRRDSTVDTLDRTLLAAQVSHTVKLGRGLSYNLRADAEGRRYDRQADVRRRDLFVRVRNRLFIPLSPRADLALTFDVQRTQSSLRDFRATQVVIGPALSASFGL